MEKRVRLRNDIHELETMNRFLEECAVDLGLPASFMINLCLVMEEAVSNIIFYAYDKDQLIEDAVFISLRFNGADLIIRVEDHGKPFDPTARLDPDITLSAEERPIGGLGIFLIKNIMDEVSYSREEGRNILLMSKCFSGK